MTTEKKPHDFRYGDQIVYIPDHCNGDLTCPGVEYGIVVHTGQPLDGYIRCIYYNAKPHQDTLRTLSSSELSPIRCLHHIYHHRDEEIEDALVLTVRHPIMFILHEMKHVLPAYLQSINDFYSPSSQPAGITDVRNEVAKVRMFVSEYLDRLDKAGSMALWSHVDDGDATDPLAAEEDDNE